MSVGWYGAPVVIDLAGMTAKAPIPILLNHDIDKIVGHADEVSIESTLKLSGIISGASAESAQVTASAANGFPWKASVGACPDKMEFIGEDVSTTVNGKTFKGPLYVARKSTLGEVSFVPMAADSKTSTKVAASAASHTKDSHMEPKLIEWLKANGFDPDAISDGQVKILRAAWKAADPDPEPKPEPTPDPTPPEPEVKAADQLIAQRARAAAEVERQGMIAAVCAEYKDQIKAPILATIQANAIKLGWDCDRTELECIRKARPDAPAIHSGTRDVQTPTIEAALCMAAGLRTVEGRYEPQILESANAYNRRNGSGVQSIILAAARDNGYDGPSRIHRGNYEEVMRSAFIRASSPSTHTLTTLLSTVGNKFLLEGFNSVESVWKEISTTRPVNDFKAITSYRMLDSLEFEEVGPAGEIKHGTLSQESFTNQAKTYAKMLGLTRVDIINDDLGAFDNIRERIGVGSGKKLNTVFWTAFLDDATFFNVTATTTAGGHANLLTTVLGETGIAAANVLLKAQKDAGGHPLGIGLQHLLLTGATLNPTAKKWYVSQELRDTTASTKTLNSNIYFNTYRPVESAYITSTTSWYFLPINGGSMAPMEVCFLNNVQTPTIESADADFNMLGVQFRGYFDFGVAQKEWRASVKSTGAG